MNQTDLVSGMVYHANGVYLLKVDNNTVLSWSAKTGLVTGHPSWVVNLPWQSYCGYASELVHTALPRACELAFNGYLVANDIEYFI